MRRRTGTFTAQGDNHKSYTIYEYTNFEDTRSHNHSLTAGIQGLKEFLTSDGEPVDWKEKGVYQIITTGVILGFSAPDAPYS